MTTGAVPGAGGVGFQSDNTTARTRMAANLVFWYLVPGRSKFAITYYPDQLRQWLELPATVLVALRALPVLS